MMLVKTVATVKTTDSAGAMVESVPVRLGVAPEPYGITPAVEDANGIPVRIVATLTTADSTGRKVDVLPVSGI